MLKQFIGWTTQEPAHTGQSLLDTWTQRDLARMQIFAQMQKFPVLLCPAAAIPAFRHGERSWQVEGKTVSYLDAWSYTEWFNLLGMPGVVIPVSQSQRELPIGVQLVARPWEEELALSIAEVVESETDGWKQPPIH